MKQIGEALSEIITAFILQGIVEPKQQAENLLCELLDCRHSDLYQQKNRPLSDAEWLNSQEWMKRRLKGEPLVYISGKMKFYHCSFEITPDVLIPRPETEILVDKIVSSLAKLDLTGKMLWDVCCGSGCIGIAIKKIFPSLSVYLTDISKKAVELSLRNALANQVDVVCLQGDLLTAFGNSKTNFVVCNPPYVSEKEYAILDKEVRDFEPPLALIGGKTGLEVYERLAKELPYHLHPHARVWLEIGYRQGDAIQQIFSDSYWKSGKVEKDWAGHDRFFFLENE